MNACASVLSVITMRHDPHISQLASLSPAGISTNVDCSTCSVSVLHPMHLYLLPLLLMRVPEFGIDCISQQANHHP